MLPVGPRIKLTLQPADSANIEIGSGVANSGCLQLDHGRSFCRITGDHVHPRYCAVRTRVCLGRNFSCVVVWVFDALTATKPFGKTKSVVTQLRRTVATPAGGFRPQLLIMEI